MANFTKEGDLGNTNIFGGKIVSKSNLRIKLLGAIEELNASIGIVVAKIDYGIIKEKIIRVQSEIMSMYMEIKDFSDYIDTKNRLITEKNIDELEAEINEISANLSQTVLSRQVLPGGSEVGSHIYMSDAICRRVEREAVQLSQVEKFNPFIIPYLNRLSHWLRIVAREVNRMKNLKEIKY